MLVVSAVLLPVFVMFHFYLNYDYDFFLSQVNVKLIILYYAQDCLRLFYI